MKDHDDGICSFFCLLIVLQAMCVGLQIATFGLISIIRIETEMELFEDIYFVCYGVITLIGMNAGAFVLCFRRKKFVFLFVLCELAAFVLFSYQVYIMVEQKKLKPEEE